MKGRFLCLLSLCLFCGWGAQVNAQQQPAGLKKGTLQEQFDFMVNESSRYQYYKVVPQAWLDTFAQHVQDTLKKKDNSILENKIALKASVKEVEQLNKDIKDLEVTNTTLEDEKNTLSFLGISMNKSVYHIIVWAIIAVLVASLLFFMGRSRYANSIAKKIRAENEELVTQVDQQRKRMLEKEQKLRRQLQDEINKRLG